LHLDFAQLQGESQMPDKTIAVCAARTNALVCNIHELITELEERIEDGELFDNPKLTRTADRVFGGTRAQGKYSPRDAYDAVEIAVNNYLLEKHASELMQMGVAKALTSVLRPLMQRLPRQTDHTLEPTELQQFSTPPTLAYLAARLIDPKPIDIVLEPSAGTGSLAIWPRAVGAKVICNETSTRRNALLRCVLNFDAFPLDAEFIDDLLPAEIQPTAVLMNPPFSSTSGRVTKTNPIYGARHIASALRRLQDGGRLVAIVSEAMGFHHPIFSEWWQRIACLCNVRASLTLDGKEYAKYGAAPDVQILVIDKTGATPGTNWQDQLKQISWGSTATLEDAWEALKHLVELSPTPHDDPDDSEPSGNLFVPCVPAKLSGGIPHPAVIVESFSKSTEPVALVPDAAPQDPASVSPDGVCTTPAEFRPIALTGERLLAAQAMRLLMRLDGELLEARAQWNQDWFRRVMHARSKAVSRLQRRWNIINPAPRVPLGSLRRRYHANLGRYLYAQGINDFGYR
jgi:hypothetical protein